MKVVVDIDENIYHRFVNGFVDEDDAVLIENLFKNGTPLPKGHGRLIDADKFQEYAYKRYFNGRIDDRKIAFINLMLSSFPTIIEADKENEE